MEKNIKVKFLILLLGGVVFCISYGGGQYDFFTMLLSSFSYLGTILILIGVLIYNVIDIIKDINNNYLYLCRLKDMQMYYKKLIIECIKSNLKILLIFFILIIAISIFGCFNNYTMPTNFYGFNFLIIVIYYALKLVILCVLFSILAIFIYIVFKYYGIAFYSLILVFCTLISQYQENFVISEIKHFSINFIDYLSYNQYAIFLHDIITFILFISIIFVIISIFRFLGLKHRGDILE